MKNRIILIVFLMLAIQTISKSQCIVNYRDVLNKYCIGEYLIHYELNNRNASNANIILEAGNSYTVYFLNPSYPFSDYQILIDGIDASKNFRIIDYEEAMKHTIDVKETKNHSFALKTKMDEKACILLAIYLQPITTKLQAGIYRSSKEFKNNKPGEEFIYSFKEVLGAPLNYEMVIDREDRKQIGEIFAASDGTDTYFNITVPNGTDFSPSVRFAKAEDLINFYYFEFYHSIPSYNSLDPSVTTLSRHLIKRIIYKKTGEVIDLTVKSLKQIIADNIELLEEFEQEKNKSTKLKQYLIKYINRNYHE